MIKLNKEDLKKRGLKGFKGFETKRGIIIFFIKNYKGFFKRSTFNIFKVTRDGKKRMLYEKEQNKKELKRALKALKRYL